MNRNDGQPPRYTRFVTTRFDLRWPVVIGACLSVIWAIASGVSSIRNVGDDGETTKEKFFDVLVAILYFVVAGAVAVGVVVSCLQNSKLARLLYIAIPVGALTAVAAQIIVVIEHYVVKNDMINQCVASTNGATLVNGNGSSEIISDSEAQSLCQSAWSRETWRVFAWLIVVIIYVIFFSGICWSYLQQLKNRTSGSSNNQSIPLQNYGQNPYANNPPPPQNNWVPPYPGPPAGGAPAYEKGDFQPVADWAGAGYAPPAGPPPQAGFGGSRQTEGALDAQEEAWERARQQGVTAHLTGHGPAPINRRQEESGYMVSNAEEDEAWERARGEGITAHLTGQQRPRRDGDVV